MWCQGLGDQSLPNIVRTPGLEDCGRGGMDVGEEMELGRLAGLREVHHITRPLGIALVAITRLDILGRLQCLGGGYDDKISTGIPCHRCTNRCSDLRTSDVVLENIAVFGSDYLRTKRPLGSHYLRMSAH